MTYIVIAVGLQWVDQPFAGRCALEQVGSDEAEAAYCAGAGMLVVHIQ